MGAPRPVSIPAARAVAVCALLGWLGLGGASPALAQTGPVNENMPFQTFFTTVCGGSVSGALNARCGDSNGGELSGDSETSLNPNQVTNGQDGSQARSRALKQSLQDRMSLRRAEAGGSASAAARLHGPLLAAQALLGGEPGAGAGAGVLGQTSPGGGTAPRLGVIMNLQGVFIDQDRRFTAIASQTNPFQTERGFEATDFRIDFGADYRLSRNLVVGGLFSYGRSDGVFDPDLATGGPFPAQANSGTNESDSYLFTFFGSYGWDSGVWLDGSFTGGPTRYDVTRSEVRAISPGTPEGATSGSPLELGGTAAYGARFGLKFQPYSITDPDGKGIDEGYS